MSNPTQTQTEAVPTPGLLPCPFCGGAVRLESGEAHGDNIFPGTLFYAVVICENRISCTANVAVYLNNYESAIKSTKEAWNRRAETVDVAGLVALLRDYRDALQDGPENMAYSTSEELGERADKLLSQLPGKAA